MIVDDYPAFRQVLKSMLQSLPVEVIECGDGQEAVHRYSETQPDLVVMDIEMKGLDGLSATRQITTQFPQARICMITQYDGTDLRTAAREAGARGFIRKDELPSIVAQAQIGNASDRAKFNLFDFENFSREP